MSAAVVIESTATSSVTKPVTGMAAQCTAALLVSIAATLGYIQMNYEWQLKQWQEQSEMVTVQAAETKASGRKDADATRDAAIGQLVGASVDFAASAIGMGAGHLAESGNTANIREIDAQNRRIQSMQPQRDNQGLEISAEPRPAVAYNEDATYDPYRTPDERTRKITELETNNKTRQSSVDRQTQRSATLSQYGTALGRICDQLAQGTGGFISAEDRVAKARKDAQLVITTYLANMFSTLAQESSSNISTNKSTNATLSQLLASIVQADSVRI